MITFDDFMKLEIKIGTVTVADRVQGTDKLIRLELDCGSETRQVVAGLAPSYTSEQLVGKQIPVLVNLEPRKLRGVESKGMILAVVVEGKAVLLMPDEHVPPGSAVR
ncbi:MAG: methionine--tRNA ligase subunit beta [Deltaproteobacteria bacterium]|nr:MAG: methionine--tRNA ligase subunit beta [Deltaproteobacteria bacterium]